MTKDDKSKFDEIQDYILYQKYPSSMSSNKGLRRNLRTYSKLADSETILDCNRRTHSNLTSSFWWPNMKLDVVNFVKCCDICQRSNTRFDKTNNELHSIPIPTKSPSISGKN
ncbi:unnamed protein product [Gordionus sp. m RMFG-2023]